MGKEMYIIKRGKLDVVADDGLKVSLKLICLAKIAEFLTSFKFGLFYLEDNATKKQFFLVFVGGGVGCGLYLAF